MIRLNDLLKIPLFASFDEQPQKLVDLMAYSEILRYEPNTKVLTEGDEDEGALWVIYEGSVGIAKIVNVKTRMAKQLGIIRQGEFFGEMSLLESAKKSATVFTLEPTTLIKISGEALQRLASDDVKLSSSLLFSLVKALSDRLRKTNTEVAILYDTGRILSSIHELDRMVKSIIERVCESLLIPSGVFMVYNELSGSFELIGNHGDSFSIHDELIHEMIRELASRKEGFRFPGYKPLNPELENRLLRSNLSVVMAVPLFSYDKLNGAMIFARPEQQSNKGEALEFSDFELNLVSGVARQASFAVENARNRQEAAARAAYSRVKRRT